MMKSKLVWFIFAICLFSGVVSCKKDKEEEDPRLVNKENKEAGERFLIENASRDSVKQTFTGLQYKVEITGKGIHPFPEDSVNVDYTGKLIDVAVFESETDRTMLLRGLIKGFQEGLQLMGEGSTHTLYIPYYLAYNATQQTARYDGKTVTIPPYSVLIFEVKLNRVTRN